MKALLFGLVASVAAAATLPANAADYIVDKEGAHAFIQFRVKHLGYSWLYGRFNDFEGNFTFDEKNPSKNAVTISVDTTSLDSNHAKRDKHLRSADFLDTKKYPEASFKSTSYKAMGDMKAELKGNLTLHGKTKPVTIDFEFGGIATDPYGNERIGFEGSTTVNRKDFGMEFNAALETGGVLVGEKVTLELEISAIKNA